MTEQLPRYDEPLKNKVRQKVLEHAVASLSSERASSTVVTDAHFRAMLEYCAQLAAKYGYPEFASISGNIYREWLTIYNSRVGTKSPHDLNVLYLSGPYPLNDLHVLLACGVLPQNIWAVEREADAYNHAIKELTDSGLPIKIHHGALQGFFQVVPQTFDIVYFDATTPIFAKNPSPAIVLKELFVNQRLAPLSALITNFCSATIDKQSSGQWSRRLSVWYAPRIEEPVYSNSEVIERVENPDRLSVHIEQHLDEYYSDFVSQFVIEFAGQLLPWWRALGLPAAKREYFADENRIKRAIKASLDTPKEIDLSNILNGFGHALLSLLSPVSSVN